VGGDIASALRAARLAAVTAAVTAAAGLEKVAAIWGHVRAEREAGGDQCSTMAYGLALRYCPGLETAEH